ncbi:glycosyltransferase family 2 protein [Maridesulfovibrio sp.]|uniref:glycosyltransferase family 2 protein n=1 Tax=unclassified Maridesulfovibrio TaxID=2794999 RepID=UPI003AFFC0C3
MDLSIPVSILIPVYNEGEHIEMLLKSCVAQNVREIFIGDNCSTDATESICRKYAEKYSCIKYIRHSENKGPSFNYWHLLKNSSCRYVAVTGGHDFYISKDHFKKLYTLCKANPDASGAYSSAKYFGGDNNVTGGYDYYYAHYLESDDSFERIKGLMGNLTDGTILYGVYKKHNILGIGEATNYGGVTDLLWLGYHLLDGKLLYASDIAFGRRMFERTAAQKYDWYNEVYGTDDFPGFWLKQAMILVKMLDVGPDKTQLLRIMAMRKYEEIRARYDSRYDSQE